MGKKASLQPVNLPISVKEARKLLGKRYRSFSDEQIADIVILLDVVAVDSVQLAVPNYYM